MLAINAQRFITKSDYTSKLFVKIPVSLDKQKKTTLIFSATKKGFDIQPVDSFYVTHQLK